MIIILQYTNFLHIKILKFFVINRLIEVQYIL
ncbi:hypothetical protein EHRUM4_05270, partial [Ehrlichia ruminantium]